MKDRFLPMIFASLMLVAPVASFAADDAPATDKPAADKPATPAPAAPTSPAAGGGIGGRLGGGGGFGGFGAIGARDPFDELIAALGDINLTTDFTLTPEQKEKIQVIVTDFKTQTDKWRTDHEADLKKIQTDMAALRNNNNNNAGGGRQAGGNNRQQMQQIAQARQTLMDTAPKSDEPIAQIKGLLTTEQLKKLQAKLDERKAEADKQRQNAFAGGNRGGGNANGAGGNAAGGANAARGRGARGGAAGGAAGGGRGGRGGGAGNGAGAGNGI